MHVQPGSPTTNSGRDKSRGSPERFLLVTADDFGIGLETSRGILELGARGLVTSTVVLVNSPLAAPSIALWRKHQQAIELGWHPCLTLDSPILPPDQVPSLIDAEGRFHSLGQFLKRIVQGRIAKAEIGAELQAQYQRYIDLVGAPPRNVNAHHHVHIFRPVREALAEVLRATTPRPYVRRVVEPLRTHIHVRGARAKRWILSNYGRRAAAYQQRSGLPGNEWLAGITDPPFVHDPEFFAHWLQTIPGKYVELTCHPGHLDKSLVGRDGTLQDGQLHRRAAELTRLSEPTFQDACEAAGFQRVTASQMADKMTSQYIASRAA